ncbi:MAG: TorF family putative porin [Hyphomicrobiaceae bacterium]
MGIGAVGRLGVGLMALAIGGMSAVAFADGLDKKSLKDSPAEEPKREWQLTYNFSATSEYVFRGFSQSAEKPAVQGGADLTYKWFYAGIWSSMIDFGRDGPFDVAHVEVDYYAGIKPVLGPVTLDIGVIYYTYPNARDGGVFANRELDYVEVKLGASGSPWKEATASATVFYSPEYTNDTGPVWTFEGTLSQNLPKIRDIVPSISGTLGYQVGDDIRYAALIGNGADDYLYWNVGLGLAFGDNFSLDFRYWDTNVSDTGGFCTGQVFQCDERFVATAKVTY